MLLLDDRLQYDKSMVFVGYISLPPHFLLQIRRFVFFAFYDNKHVALVFLRDAPAAEKDNHRGSRR